MLSDSFRMACARPCLVCARPLCADVLGTLTGNALTLNGGACERSGEHWTQANVDCAKGDAKGARGLFPTTSAAAGGGAGGSGIDWSSGLAMASASGLAMASAQLENGTSEAPFARAQCIRARADAQNRSVLARMAFAPCALRSRCDFGHRQPD